MYDDQPVDIDPEFKAIKGGVTQSIEHDSATKHVTGKAVYVDDLPEPRNLLHVQLGLSDRAHARIVRLNLDAVKSAAGVVGVFTAADVDGSNDFGHGGHGDDQVFAQDLVEFHGQAIFGVAAESFAAARAAARLAEVEYEDLEPILTIDQALQEQSYVSPPLVLEQGDAAKALEQSSNRLSGQVRCGGQEHFYLEPQVSMALPKEDGDVHVYCATQDPGAVQHLVARILAKPAHAVTVEVRRMGGAFGGKETSATHFAAVAAVVAGKTGRPAKCRLDRDDDMALTGKRHGFQFDYDVGFDDTGLINGMTMQVAAHAGYSEDQSPYILQRAMYHCDGAYYFDNATIKGFACKTNTCTSCAFRGFGSPQALLAVERVIDEIAFHLDKDPLEIRKINLYGETDRNTTPYGWKIRDNILPRMIQELESSSDYQARRKSIREFNAESNWIKKGFALMPLKYSVGFSATFLNQAGALIHIYQDGSIHLNHGGTEMGQGLYQKVAQVVAQEFQVDISEIRITSTVTDKVPNTTATAASSGSDMNGAAAQIAARTIKSRLTDFAAESFKVDSSQVVFCNGRVKAGGHDISFKELVSQAYMNLISLSATGFYTNPEIGVDAKTMKGRPYHYSAYGVAAVEVAIDVLTGESKMLRFDLLHDVGNSLNPAIDLGQLEGGFVQGMGWVTSEELVWGGDGKLQTHAPSTYKIPVCGDCPEDVRMQLVDWNANVENTVFRSKAIGEPPFNLAVSVFNALTDAVASVGDYKQCPRLNAPATPQEILRAVEEIRGLNQVTDSQKQTSAA
jgi:xanthine dehydrogenase large subunit